MLPGPAGGLDILNPANVDVSFGRRWPPTHTDHRETWVLAGLAPLPRPALSTEGAMMSREQDTNVGVRFRVSR